ncbi:hypothetical protein CDD83_134 [Cordyceps sp. RAO-2017]|nr:hypothetical protein CDD83_134 [Cordyceps sp. RAO-2017]
MARAAKLSCICGPAGGANRRRSLPSSPAPSSAGRDPSGQSGAPWPGSRWHREDARMGAASRAAARGPNKPWPESAILVGGRTGGPVQAGQQHLGQVVGAAEGQEQASLSQREREGERCSGEADDDVFFCHPSFSYEVPSPVEEGTPPSSRLLLPDFTKVGEPRYVITISYLTVSSPTYLLRYNLPDFKPFNSLLQRDEPSRKLSSRLRDSFSLCELPAAHLLACYLGQQRLIAAVPTP